MKALQFRSKQAPATTKPFSVSALSWFDNPLGHLLSSNEVKKVEQLLPAKYYATCVQLGLPANRSYLMTERAGLHIYISNMLASHDNKDDMGGHLCVSEFSQLPLGKRAVDLVIMPHTLDLSHHPLQVLREVSQVIDDDGTLVLTGFNPASLLGCTKYLSNKLSYNTIMPSSHTPVRVKEWLQLIGFEVTASCYMDYLPAISRPGLRRWLGFLDKAGDRWWPVFAGIYVIVAKKQIWRPERISMFESLANRLNPKLNLEKSVGSRKSNCPMTFSKSNQAETKDV